METEQLSKPSTDIDNNTTPNQEEKEAIEEKEVIEEKSQKIKINHPTFATSINKKYKNLIHCYLCKIEDCQKIFKTNQELIEHRKSHTQIHTCPIEGCNKSFKEITNLRKHHKHHFPTEKRYFCPFEGCGKCFTASYNLTIHYRIHIGKKPYKCQKCGKGFFDKANYKYHISSKHLNINTKKLICQHKNCKHKSKSIKQRLMHHDKLEEFCIQEKNLLINLIMIYQESTVCLLNSQFYKKKEEKKENLNNDVDSNIIFDENKIINEIKSFNFEDVDLKNDLDNIFLQSKVVFNRAINQDQYQDLIDECKK